MKAFTTIATVAALASVSYAATVTLEETPCLQPKGDLQTFTIDTDKLVEKELKSVCGLKINSATDVDVNAISCVAYKDKEGKEVGSATFTIKQPALISTNPVQENSIRCSVNGTTGASSPSVSMGTASPTPNGNGSLTNPTPTPSGSGPPSGTAAGAPEDSGAAGRTGLSVGAAIAGFAVFLL